MVKRIDTSLERAETGRESLVSSVAQIDESCRKMEEVASQAQATATSVTEQSAAMNEISSAAEEIAILAEKSTNNSEAALESVSRTESIVNEQFEDIGEMNNSLFVLYRAQADHYLWKKHLAELLAGRSALNSVELKDCHQCRLGKWYDQAKESLDFQGNELFERLFEPHERVHKLGKLAADRFAQNDRAGAIEAYQKLEKASKIVVSLLSELIKRFERS